MNGALRVLTITSEWINTGHGAPFIARQVEFLRRAGVDVEVFAFRGAKNPIQAGAIRSDTCPVWSERAAGLAEEHASGGDSSRR